MTNFALQDKEKVQLKRELGLFSAVNMIVAVMIGTKTKLSMSGWELSRSRFKS